MSHVMGGTGILQFLSLPDEVKISVFRFLDTSGILNARLTSREFKRSVEQPEILENARVTVINSRRLQRIIESRAPFNHFVLNFQRLDEQTYLEDFSRIYGPTIRILNVKTLGGKVKLMRLLEKCAQLKVFEINGLDPSLYLQSTERLNVFIKSLTNLRILRIHKLEGGDSGMAQINFFITLLRACRKLIEVEIPEISDYNKQLGLRRHMSIDLNLDAGNIAHEEDNDEENWEQPEELNLSRCPIPEWDIHAKHDILLDPLIEYIKSKSSNIPLKRLILSGAKCLETKSFNALISTCHRYDVKVYGLRSFQFYDTCSTFPVDPIDNSYCDIVREAHVLHFNRVFRPSMLRNVTDLKIIVNPVINPWDSCSSYDFILDSLTFLSIQFNFDATGSTYQNLIQKLCKDRKRPSVKKLRLEWTFNSPTLTAIDISQNFYNVCDLTIHECAVGNCDLRLLWRGLQKIERLEIFNCRLITNAAFVNASFMSLSKLKSVCIRDVTGNVNEEAVLHSFRWMKLRRFELSSTRIPWFPQKVFWKLIDTPLGKCVEYLSMPKPDPIDGYFDAWNLMKGFTNLKRRSCW